MFTFFLVIIAGVSCYVQIVDIRNQTDKIENTINLKQDISQNVSFVTKVNKEIANLEDMLMQEDKAKVTEVFTKRDLESRVKKIVPPDNLGPYTPALVIVELKKIPLPHSVVVQTQTETFASTAIQSVRNLLEIRFLKSIPNGILDKITDFIEVSYIPDPASKEKLCSVNGLGVKYNFDGNGSIQFKEY